MFACVGSALCLPWRVAVGSALGAPRQSGDYSIDSSQDASHEFNEAYSGLLIEALVAFPDGTFPSELLLCLETPGSPGDAHLHHFTALEGGVVRQTLGLPLAMQSGRVRATFWWGGDFDVLPPAEDTLFDASTAPFAAQRTGFVSNGQLSLGRMVLALPPHVASIIVSAAEPHEFVVASDEPGAFHPLGLSYDAVHDSSFELCTWSREPSWWLAAKTLGGTQSFSTELVRDSVVTVALSASGTISGTVSGQYAAEGWTVVAVPQDGDGSYPDLSPHPSLSATVMSMLAGSPRSKVASSSFLLDGLSAGEYLVALIAPGYELVSFAPIVVSPGAVATVQF